MRCANYLYVFENASVANYDKSTLDLTSRAMHATSPPPLRSPQLNARRQKCRTPSWPVPSVGMISVVCDNQPIISVSFVTLRSDTAFPESGETHHQKMHFALCVSNVRANCAFFHDDLVDIPK